MDTINSAMNQKFDLQAMLKSNDVSAGTQSHLARVYSVLSLGLGVAALGSWIHLQTHLGGVLSTLATFGFLLWLSFDQDKSNQLKRIGIFSGFCFAKGLSIGGLVEQLLFIDPSIVFSALLGTVGIFACFSLSAMLSKRRSLLYIGGICGGVLSMLMWGSLISMFWRSQFMMDVQLYVGLFMFMGYVVFDTQLIIEKSEALLSAGSHSDVAEDALKLFIDFVAIFVRLAIILSKNKGEKRDRKERR